MKNLIKIAKAGIFAVLATPFVVAFNFYFPFVGPKGIYLTSICEIVFFLWLVCAIKSKDFRPNFKNPVVAAVGIFLALSFLSAIFGVNFSASFWSKFERMNGILMLIHLAGLFLAATLIMNKNDWRNFTLLAAFAGAVVGLSSIFNHSESAKGGGVMGNDSFLGVFLVFAIFWCLREFAGLGKKGKIYLAACFAIMFWALFASDARAAQLSVIAGIILIIPLWLIFASKRIFYKRIGIGMLILGLLSSLILIIAASIPGSFIHEKAIQKFSPATINSRIVVWDIAWKGFIERPIFGWGRENYDAVFAKYYNPCLGLKDCGTSIWYDRAHNIVFDMLISGGMVGFISYLSLFVASFWMLWKKYVSKNLGFFSAVSMVLVFFTYFLQNLTVFETVESNMMFFLSMAFCASQDNSNSESKNKTIGIKPFKKILLGLAAIICFYNFVLAPLQTDYLSVATVKYGVAKKPDGSAQTVEDYPFGSSQRREAYEKTFSISPMGKFQIRLFFAQAFLNALSGKERLIQKEDQIKEFEFLTSELQKSVNEYPLDYKSRIVLGELYNNWSLIDKTKLGLAQSVLDIAVKMAPNNQQGYWKLAQTKMYQADISAAIGLASQAYNLEPRNEKAKQVVDEIQGIKNNLDKKNSK